MNRCIKKSENKEFYIANGKILISFTVKKQQLSVYLTAVFVIIKDVLFFRQREKENRENTMSYSLNDIFIKIGQTIDVVYLIDLEADTYTTLKDNKLFHDCYGDGGSYKDMMYSFLERSVDSKVTKDKPYGIFTDLKSEYTEELPHNTRMSFGDRDIYIFISVHAIDETHKAILITERSEDEYNEAIYIDQKMNVLKSAYLFTMNVDLKEDTCGSISMSEVNVTPVNAPKLKYSQWRSMIVNMFLPEDRDIFNEISDPDYLIKNLSYQRSNSIDLQMKNLDGVFIWVKLIFHRINTGNDEDFKFLYMVEDIHDSHMRLVDDLTKFEYLSKHDSLTGLLSRDALDSEINARIKKCRTEQKPVSLLMSDIDHFTQVNDTHVHSTGDVILKEISSLVNERISEFGGELGRWGGEEFVGVFENTNVYEITIIAESIRVAVEKHSFETVGKVTISIGALEVGESETVKSAFEKMDAALYRAKNKGRNRVFTVE